MRQAGNALFVLTELAGDKADMVTLARLALERLNYDRNERVAVKLLMTILMHDELAERIATGIMPTHCLNCRGKEGSYVYVPMED